MEPGAGMVQEVDQYFYTAAPIGGTGFHIVGGPDREGADAEAVRRLIRNLVQYQVPFDLSPHASEAEIAERFPVAVRAACTEQGSAVVLRSCYIGPEYQSDGPGSRPGNYFGHALVLGATAPGVGPMTVARAVESAGLWRTGLLPEELGSRDELKLPRIAVDLTASEDVEARHGDEPVLAGLIARIAGGGPVFLANTPWSEAFAVFQRVERFLPSSLAARLKWSTYENNLRRGMDILASQGETELSKAAQGVFCPGRSLPDDNAHWAARQLIAQRSTQEVEWFWERVELLGGQAAASGGSEPQRLLYALEMFSRVESVLSDNENGPAARALLSDLWAHLSETNPTPKRIELLTELYQVVCKPGALDTLQALKEVARLRGAIGDWAGSALERADLDASAYRLTVEAALASDRGAQELGSDLSRLDNADAGLRPAMATLFREQLKHWQRTEAARRSPVEEISRHIAVGSHLGIGNRALWRMALHAPVESCFSERLQASDQALAERIGFLAERGVSMVDILDMARDLVPRSSAERPETLQDFYLACHSAVARIASTSGRNAFGDILLDLAQRQSLKPMIAAIVGIEAEQRLLQEDPFHWLDSLLSQIDKAAKGFMETYGQAIAVQVAVEAMNQGSAINLDRCFDALEPAQKLVRREALTRSEADRFAEQLDRAFGETGGGRGALARSEALLGFLGDDDVEQYAALCPNALCLIASERPDDPRARKLLTSPQALALIREKAATKLFSRALKKLVPGTLGPAIATCDVLGGREIAMFFWSAGEETMLNALFSDAARKFMGSSPEEIEDIAAAIGAAAQVRQPAERALLKALREVAVNRAAKLPPQTLDKIEEPFLRGSRRAPGGFFEDVRIKSRNRPLNIAKSMFKKIIKIGER